MIILLVPSFSAFLDKLFPIQSITSDLSVSSGVGRRWHLLCLSACVAWRELMTPI